MKIVVIGGTGLIGKKLIPLLRERGHEAVAASPSSGVNILTGEGLAEALSGGSGCRRRVELAILRGSGGAGVLRDVGRNLLAAEAAAGVGHHVALSVVGADRLPDSGYMRAKLAQEKLIESSQVPYTILRATQFFEFLGGIADSGADGDMVRLPTALMQPLAADDVAAELARIAVESPINGKLELAGPEALPMAAYVGRALSASRDARKVIADPEAFYFGAAINDGSLTPGDNPRIGPTHFEDWLSRSVSQA